MIRESTRQSYLNAMGITQWQLRPAESESVTHPSDVEITETTETTRLSETEQNNLPSDPVSTSAQRKQSSIVKGLSWLNQGSSNGLLVVLSEQRKQLNTESRELMSKMLKSIHFLPSETGFAVISEQISSAAESVSLDSIKAILVFGNEAGRQLVKISGARIIPGSETFTLDGRKIVISFHPDDVLNNPEYKQQTWNDLKQLVEFFNNC